MIKFRKLAAVLAAMMLSMTVVTPVSAATAINDLTGQPIDASLALQRPIAVMVDNSTIALPHFGTAEADIVYEIINSLANNRITRLMCVYKNWNAIPQIGNIRSARPTNIMLAEEYNAVLIHDGGPFYNNPYLANPANTNISGSYTRVNNGKATEFTEYVMAGEAAARMARAGVPSTYTINPGPHFNFGVNNLAAIGGLPCTKITLPFPYNKSQLIYNPATGLYDYYENGQLHKDAVTGKTMSFTNVFVQVCTFTQYDQNGYLIFNVIGENQIGFYCSGGAMVPVLWKKLSESDKTRFYAASGAEMVVNPGKTYIAIVPNDTAGQVHWN